MKRRRHQAGSLMKSHGAWYLRMRQDELQADGSIQRVQKAEYLAPAEGETRSKKSKVLESLMAERMAVINGGRDSITPLALMTVADFVEQEYLPYVRKELRLSSVLTRESIYRSQIKPRLGHIRLRDFRTSSGDAFLQAIADEGKVHRSYIRAVKTLLSSIFRYARRKDAITTANPMTDAVVPRSARQLGKRGTYVLADIMRMLQALDGTARVLVATAAFTGLRMGELQGLQWDDYDGCQLFVRHNIWRGIAGVVKTESSEAPVPVIPYLRRLLDEHRLTASSKFVFSDKRGSWLRLGHFAHDYLALKLAEMGIPWHGYHGFRRGLATNLHDLGVDDQTIQRILRHSNVRITQDAYIRTLSHQAVDAMAQLEAEVAYREASVKQTIS